MLEIEIQGLAAARGQYYTKCFLRGKPVFLMHDRNPCSLNELAGSLDTDAYDDYLSGKFQVETIGTYRKLDMQGDEIIDWSDHTVFFNEKKELTKRQKQIVKVLKNGGFAQPALSNKANLYDNKSNKIACLVRDTLINLEKQGLIVQDQYGTWIAMEEANGFK